MPMDYSQTSELPRCRLIRPSLRNCKTSWLSPGHDEWTAQGFADPTGPDQQALPSAEAAKEAALADFAEGTGSQAKVAPAASPVTN